MASTRGESVTLGAFHPVKARYITFGWMMRQPPRRACHESDAIALRTHVLYGDQLALRVDATVSGPKRCESLPAAVPKIIEQQGEHGNDQRHRRRQHSDDR